MKLIVKVVPGSSKTQISGWLGDALKVRVTEPPEKGKANLSVRKLLSQALELPMDSVHITSGTSSSRKTVEIQGLNESAVRKRLRQS